MKSSYIVKGVVSFIILLNSLGGLAQANFSLKYVVASVSGTSSLHDWESKITTLDFKGYLTITDDRLSSVKDVTIKIPVKGIKSSEGKTMDRKTFEAFDGRHNPFIIYTLSKADVNIAADRLVTIDASGKLTMAGTTKTISLTSKGSVLPNGDVQLTISKKLKMTDFNMVPPTAVLGTIRVGDEITVNFDIVLVPRNAVN